MANDTKVTKLSGAALRKLRALGHDLAPVIQIGKEGITESLVRATDAALERHELIKVKVQANAGGAAPVDRHQGAIDLAARTGSVLAQVLGRTALLYRRHPKKPKIVLPKPGENATKKAKKTRAGKAVERAPKAPAEDVENPQED